MKVLAIVLVIKVMGLGTIELPGFKTQAACNEAAVTVRHGAVIQNGVRLELGGRIEDVHCEGR